MQGTGREALRGSPYVRTARATRSTQALPALWASACFWVLASSWAAAPGLPAAAPPPVPPPRLLGPSDPTPSKKGFCGSSPVWGGCRHLGTPSPLPHPVPSKLHPCSEPRTCELSIKLLPSLTARPPVPAWAGEGAGQGYDLEAPGHHADAAWWPGPRDCTPVTLPGKVRSLTLTQEVSLHCRTGDRAAPRGGREGRAHRPSRAKMGRHLSEPRRLGPAPGL